jgi:two-component sensor histidine kinase
MAANVVVPHMKWTLTNHWCHGWRRGNPLAYCGGVLGVGIALLLTALISPLHSTPSVLFFGAVALTAWGGGKGPAFLATLLSILAIDYFFVYPFFSVFTTLADLVVFGAFTFVALLICYLQDSFQRIVVELAQANEVLLEQTTKLAAALKENEVLLRELQHRVKNNLQVISSLLSLQCGKLRDQASRELFKECQQRIRAIALVHETLYRAPKLGNLDVAVYFRDIVQNLLRCYCVNSGAVKPRIDVEAAAVGMDRLISCGLIVNELVCNALKHAFPEGRSGEVRVELYKKDGQVSLRVADDGVGFFPSGVPGAGGVGQQIVKALVEQLSGKLDWANGRGTTATVTFPETN